MALSLGRELARPTNNARVRKRNIFTQKLRRAKWNVIIEQKNWIDKISDIFV